MRLQDILLPRNGSRDTVTPQLAWDNRELLASSWKLPDQTMNRASQLRASVVPTLLGSSLQMQKASHLIERLKNHSYPVLILGETRTGKELVARATHYSGVRRSSPFVPVDCATISPTLVESELFGYVKGAFTRAEINRPGLLEAAKDGTLFLDEIGEMPLEMQTKLLRVLQEKELRPVGSNQRIQFQARVIAATNRDLDAERRFPESRRKAYYLMAIHERLTRVPKHELKEVGWTKATELAKLARREGQRFESAIWLH